ncbi:MAG: helicase associated domain-containing protein [Actinobacteria bacterium]|nr:helicase associated domain-containing protein [Actinomycetota bacterium]
MALLESQKDWAWDPNEAEWQKNFAALEEYVQENNDALVPGLHKTTDGIFLGSWLSVQRRIYKKGQLSQERIALLESKKDWTWNQLEADWQKNFAALEEYVQENNDALVPNNHKTTNGILLGQWASYQRSA